MKHILLFSSFISLVSLGQIQTTTGSGNFFNPLLWDCFCIPANGDTLVVNHAMVLPSSIYYDQGQITISASGSVTEDGGGNRDVWVDGTGKLINNGTFDCYRLYVSDGLFDNNSNAVYFDSLWNQGTINNSGLITVYDILNDQTGSFTNSGVFNVTNNFNNQGYFDNSGTVDISLDFSNCNIQSMDAILENTGTFCVGDDFTNCLDDTLTGNGVFYIGDQSSNFGVFNGNFVFHTPTGALNINTGTVSGSVTFGTGVCGLSISENMPSFNVFPNPVNEIIYFSESNLNYIIYDITGKIVQQGLTSTSGIDVSQLNSGIYSLQLIDNNQNQHSYKLIKE